MKTRLFDNWITSLMGVVVFGFGIYMFFAGKITDVGFGGLVALALTLLRAKDSLIPGVDAK